MNRALVWRRFWCARSFASWSICATAGCRFCWSSRTCARRYRFPITVTCSKWATLSRKAPAPSWRAILACWGPIWVSNEPPDNALLCRLHWEAGLLPGGQTTSVPKYVREARHSRAQCRVIRLPASDPLAEENQRHFAVALHERVQCIGQRALKAIVERAE